MKLRRTLALTLILTLLLSLFCGCEKKDKNIKTSQKTKTSQKEKSASEIYEEANKLLEDHSAYQLSEKVKAKLVEGDEETEFKMDIDLISSGEKDKDPAFYSRNVVSVGTVLIEQSTTYVDGVCYVKEVDSLYRQKMTPDEFIEYYDETEESDTDFSISYFEKAEISGTKAKTVKYSAPKKDNLDEITEFFSNIITAFFDDGDITDASGEFETDEDGSLLSESIRITGTAHSDGKLGEFDIEMKIMVENLDDDADEIQKPADAESYIEVKSIKAAIDAYYALSGMFNQSVGNFDYTYNLSIGGNFNISNKHKSDVNYKINDEGVIYQLYVNGTDTLTSQGSSKTTDHIIDYSGNSMKISIYGKTGNGVPTDEETASIFMNRIIATAPLNMKQITAASVTEKDGKRTITYSVSNADFEEWGKLLAANLSIQITSIAVKSGGSAQVVLDEDDNVVSTKIKKTFTIKAYGETADMTVESTTKFK